LGRTAGYLVAHFGADRPLDTITPGDADESQVFLKGKGLSEATIRRRCGAAKQFFKAAVRKGLLPSNSFADLKAANLANPARAFYVDGDTARKVVAACPDAQWRLIFTLCRFGGLRCPSEVLGLTWGDIHWAENQFTVRSPKTAHHVGHESRQVPIVPELLPFLREGFEAAEPGAEYVITRYRRSNAKLSTQLRRILWGASIDPWPRLFQNLRASFATDLAARYPGHLCERWLGHTPQIAAKHYWQVTDRDFATASAAPLLASAPGVTSEATRAGEQATRAGEQATRKAAQSGAADPCPDLPRAPGQDGKPAIVASGQRVAVGGMDECRGMVGDTGLEPVTSCVSSRRSSHLS